MKRYSIIHIPVLSFFSKELYRDVGLNWRGFGFLYLLLLLAICSIPGMFKMKEGLSNFIEKDVPPLLEQLPGITIADGQVSVDVPQPYYIRDPDSNDILAIIDTTGEIESLVDTGALVLLTKTKLIYRKSEVEYRIYELSTIKEELILDQERIMGWLNTFEKVFVPVLYPIIVLGAYVFRIIQALIYGVIGLIFASWLRVKLLYSSALRLAVVAVTPCIIINTVLIGTSVKLPFSTTVLWLLFFLITMAYLLLGVKSCSQMDMQSPLQGEVLPKDEQRL